MQSSDDVGPARTPVAAARVRPRRMFGIKDLFTVINAMGGVVAICLCIEGEPYQAGLAVIIGYLCGDTLDGWVARKLGTSNSFGAEFDTIADHLAHCIAPGAVVYAVYRDVDLGLAPWPQQWLAIALAGSVMVTASIRHARNVVRPIDVKGVWFGLPRTTLGFMALAYVNARLAPDLPGGWWVGVVLIPACCIAALTYLPYPSHRMASPHLRYVIPFSAAFVIGNAVALVLHPEYVFDVVFLFCAAYAVAAPLTFTSAQRASYREVVQRVMAEGRT